MNTLSYIQNIAKILLSAKLTHLCQLRTGANRYTRTWTISSINARQLPPASISIITVTALFLLLLLPGCADYDLLDTGTPQPPEPVTLSTASVTDSSVTLSWTKSVSDSFKGYIIYYTEGDYVGLTDKIHDTLSFSIDTIITVSHLKALSLYSFRVSVLSQNGTYSPSNIIRATTLENMKGKLRLSWNIHSSGTEAYLQWTKSITPCTQYRVYFDTLSVVDSTDSLIGAYYNTAVDTIHILRDTPLGQSRWYRVYAQNDTSFVAKSNIVKGFITP